MIVGFICVKECPFCEKFHHCETCNDSGFIKETIDLESFMQFIGAPKWPCYKGGERAILNPNTCYHPECKR